jgi:hypothetical protein
MLPDFPKVKRRILQSIGGFMNQSAAQDPLLGAVPRFVQHEGNRSTIRREDGTEKTIDFREPIEATAVVSTQDIREKGPAVTREAVSKLTTDLNRGMAERMLNEISEASDEIGNTVSAEGKPFSLELFLGVLRKLELTFDDEGNWIHPQIATSPKNRETIESVLKLAENDDKFLSERDAIVTKQREEWRAREADRRLVD